MPDPGSTNPYLALLQQSERPRASFWDVLGNTLLGAGAGISQAGAQGRGWGSGIGPGLMMGNQMTAQAEHQAEQERMRRFQIGIQASEWDEKRQERLRKEKALEDYLKAPGLNAAPPPYQLGPDGQSPQGDAASRIGGIESGGRYDAVGPVANKSGNRAYGKYQVMDFNIGPWTQEVLGRSMTPQEFLADQKAQDAVFNAKFGAYQQKYGPAGAARAWFAGEGGMNNPNARDVLGTSVADYERKFAGGGAPGPRMAGPPGAPPAVDGSRMSLPQFATLPPFEGPGMGTIQPGATNDPTLVRPPLGDGVPPPQVGQGDQVTPGGSRVDTSIPPPQFMQPGGQPPTPDGPPPGQPSMAPANGSNPPPVYVPPAQVPVPDNVVRHFKGLAAAGIMPVPAAEKAIQDYGAELNKQVHEASRAQFTARVEMWKQREQIAIEQRKIQAQVEAEQRAVAQRQKEHERDRSEKGTWIRRNGVETFVPEKDITAGTTREDAPKPPPAPGTPAGDDHILSTADPGSVEYRDAYRRQQSTPHVINGQPYIRDMTKVPPPTYGQPPGAPAAAAAPAPSAKPSDVPGMTPVGEKNYTEAQGKDYTYASRLKNSIPQLEAMLKDEGGKLSTKNLPSSWERTLGEATIAGVGAPEYLVSNREKEFRRLAKDIVTAVLRRESGASIPTAEYAPEYQKYIPLPSDNEREIKAKLRALRVAAKSIAEGSGRPLDQFGGVFDEAPPVEIDLSGNKK